MSDGSKIEEPRPVQAEKMEEIRPTEHGFVDVAYDEDDQPESEQQADVEQEHDDN